MGFTGPRLPRRGSQGPLVCSCRTRGHVDPARVGERDRLSGLGGVVDRWNHPTPSLFLVHIWTDRLWCRGSSRPGSRSPHAGTDDMLPGVLLARGGAPGARGHRKGVKGYHVCRRSLREAAAVSEG
ncbi:hypothetical protein XENOCAPTIV_009041 [Xenoophorus captivus]|uniref:MHC class I antigen n=1 Tax=Xenoophorus captivus TaxID=1517983 RepID=A0ABV0SGZ5_9TELE